MFLSFEGQCFQSKCAFTGMAASKRNEAKALQCNLVKYHNNKKENVKEIQQQTCVNEFNSFQFN